MARAGLEARAPLAPSRGGDPSLAATLPAAWASWEGATGREGTGAGAAAFSSAMTTAAVPLGSADLGEQLAALATGVGVAWEWQPELLRVTGREPLAALDRIVTQAVKDLTPGEGKLALVLHAKGQFRGLFAVLAGESEVLLLAPPGRGGEVAAQLERYLALSRCRVAAVPVVGTATVSGPGWEAVAGGCGAEVERLHRGGWSATGEGEERLTWCGWTFLGVPGVTVAAAGKAGLAALRRRLEERGAVAVGSEALEVARITAAWPAWGAELSETTLPPEIAILDDLAISYRKGCYTGQETIARMKTYGHPNWRLERLRQVGGGEEAPDLPAELYLPAGDKPKGRLTSWARHPEHGGVALALLHRTVAPGAALHDRRGREFVPPD